MSSCKSFYTGWNNKRQSDIYLYPPNGPKVAVPFHPPYADEELKNFSMFESDLLDQREKAGEAMLNLTKLNLLNPFSEEVKFYDQITPDEQMKSIIRNQYMELKQKEKLLKGVPDRLKPIFKKIFEEKGLSERPEEFDSVINYYANSGIINEADARDIKRIIQNNIIFKQELRDASQREHRELEALKAQLRAEFGSRGGNFDRIFNRAVMTSRAFSDIPTSRRELINTLRNAIIREYNARQEETSGPAPPNMAAASQAFQEENDEDDLFDATFTQNNGYASARAATRPMFQRGEESRLVFGGPQRGASSRDVQNEILEGLVRFEDQGRFIDLRPSPMRGPTPYFDFPRFSEGIENELGRRILQEEQERVFIEPGRRRIILGPSRRTPQSAAEVALLEDVPAEEGVMVRTEQARRITRARPKLADLPQGIRDEIARFRRERERLTPDQRAEQGRRINQRLLTEQLGVNMNINSGNLSFNI